MNNNKQILLAFYGDDFTGSTDALESICRAGAKAILFLDPPTPTQLAAYPDLEAFGVAGKTRSLPPDEVEKILIPAFEILKLTGARHVHYKVCSTFDSSVTIGSIGKAIDCGAKVFGNELIPVIGGTPGLGRYCIFGNLFARMGIGSNGDIHRIDRHPSMSRHPVTPADESDLRLHIGRQTDKKIGLIDILQLDKPVEAWKENLNEVEKVVLIDALYDEQLKKIGSWLDEQHNGNATLFSVGGSSVETALSKHWYSQQTLQSVADWKQLGKAEPLLVISGSCSPITASQIAWATRNQFEEVIINAIKICSDDRVEESVFIQVNELLKRQKNVIVHTGDKQLQNLSSQKLGTALGNIAKTAAENSLVKRVVLSGGDTSSYAARAMDIEAVEMIAPLVIGAPLCRAISANKAINGLEVNFKGGQVGSEDYFGVLMNGGILIFLLLRDRVRAQRSNLRGNKQSSNQCGGLPRALNLAMAVQICLPFGVNGQIVIPHLNGASPMKPHNSTGLCFQKKKKLK